MRGDSGEPCIWVAVYDRAKAANRVEDLKIFIPPRNRALQGTSSFINYLLDKDSRPEHPQPLINISNIRAEVVEEVQPQINADSRR